MPLVLMPFLSTVCLVKSGKRTWARWFAIAALAAGLVAMLWPSERPTPAPGSRNAAPAEEGPDAAPISLLDTESSLAKLRTRAEVHFVPADAATLVAQDPPPPTLTSLGPLQGAELTALKGVADTLYTARSKALTDHQAQMSASSLRDAKIEAESMYRVEAALAIQQAILAGHYIVLPRGQEVPQGSGEEVTRWGCTKDGQKAIAWIVLRDAEYPALAEIRRYVETTASALREETINRFNALPLGQRQDILRRKSALDAKGRNAWGPEDMDFVLTWFPDFIAIDQSNATMRATRP